MNECIERGSVVVLETDCDGGEPTGTDRRSESVSRQRSGVIRLRLRLVDGSALERESGSRHTGGDVPASHSEIVLDIDLEELLSSVGTVAGKGAEPVYRFGDCELSIGRRSLIRDGREVHLRPKVFRLLAHLLENRGRALSRDELCDAVWDGRCVGNATIDSTVQALRRAVGDDGVEQRVVQTISGHGYRFAASVEVDVADGERLRTPLHRRPRQSPLHVVGGRTASLHGELRASA